MTRNHSKIDRRAVFASAAAAALLAATGVRAAQTPQRGGRLRLALSGASRLDGFDPRLPAGLFMRVASGAVFETLTEIAADGALHPELALDWQSNNAATRWELSLRQDARFHDGSGFTAADAAASLGLHLGNPVLNLAEVRATGPYRIEVALHDGAPDFPYRLSDPQFIMLPQGDLKRAMAEGIGTGLYRIAQFQPGARALVSRVAEHYKDGRAGWFDELELVSIPAAEVRAEALAGGYVDGADLAPDFRGPGMLPAPRGVAQAVAAGVACPPQIGTCAPMDNFRAGERWWFA
jgi:ABC-type transport system substrate-binding protein